MIKYITKVIFKKCQILTCVFFSFLNVSNVRLDLVVSENTATLSAKFVLKNA